MPDERVVELSRLWWEKAEADLAAAERLTDLFFVSCFHSQQAVEKAIKAILVLHQVDFSRSHDIGALLRQLDTIGVAPPQDTADDLAGLTRFSVGTRYPPDDATPEETEEAFSLARHFLEWGCALLPEPAPPTDSPTRQMPPNPE